MRLKSSSVSNDFFCSLYLWSHFRQVEMWGLEQGQESNWCRVGGGRALYSTQPSHSHTAQGRGLLQASGARLLHLAVPGPGCGCQLEKCSTSFMTDVRSWEHAVRGLTIYSHIAMSALRYVCTGGWLGGGPYHQSPHSQPRATRRSEEATGVFMESMDKKFIDENISDNLTWWIEFLNLP